MPIEEVAHDLTMLYLQRMTNLAHVPGAYISVYKQVYEEILKTLQQH